MFMEYFLVYASPIPLAALVILLYFLVEKFFPSSIEKSHKGKLGDSYSVSVCVMGGKGTPWYVEHVFTKRKNGKYRLQFGTFVWFIIITIVVPVCALYAFIISVILKDDFMNLWEPISYIAVVGVCLLLFIALMGNPTIRAIYHFKKFEKGFQMKK